MDRTTMPEPLPFIFRLPTALSWADAKARLLARADGLVPGTSLDVRFFVDTRLVAHAKVGSPADAHRTVAAVAHLSGLAFTSDASGGGWERRGALSIRVSSADAGLPAGRSFEVFAEHRTAAELARFLHHIHWIPQSRGITDAFVDKCFPGRTWQGLVLVLQAANVFVGRGGSPPSLMPTVTTVHFTDAARWAVEWEDGAVTASPLDDRPIPTH